jgi:hypothetical protein
VLTLPLERFSLDQRQPFSRVDRDIDPVTV